jgi:hypothetical protein
MCKELRYTASMAANVCSSALIGRLQSRALVFTIRSTSGLTRSSWPAGRRRAANGAPLDGKLNSAGVVAAVSSVQVGDVPVVACAAATCRLFCHLLVG